MQQVQLDRYGGPEELHLVERPDPVAGPGQVVVQAEAAGITFVETQMRAGRSPRPGPPPEPPFVLGNGVEGKVVATGAGVDLDLLGQRVVTATGGFGGYASHVVVAATEVLLVPDELGVGEAVALLADGRTALALTRAAAIGPDDRVLVTAAAGGVGTLLLQLARSAGARMIIAALGGSTVTSGGAGTGKAAADATGGGPSNTDARATDATGGGPSNTDARATDATGDGPRDTDARAIDEVNDEVSGDGASDPTGDGASDTTGDGDGLDKAAIALRLGATMAVDYRSPGWSRNLGPVTVAFDGVGGEVGRQVFELVAPGGRFLSYGAAGGAMTDTREASTRGVTVIAGYSLIQGPEDNRSLVETALREAAAQRLAPVIGQRFRLAEAAAAHAAIEARATVGKTLLIP